MGWNSEDATSYVNMSCVQRTHEAAVSVASAGVGVVKHHYTTHMWYTSTNGVRLAVVESARRKQPCGIKKPDRERPGPW